MCVYLIIVRSVCVKFVCIFGKKVFIISSMNVCMLRGLGLQTCFDCFLWCRLCNMVFLLSQCGGVGIMLVLVSVFSSVCMINTLLG